MLRYLSTISKFKYCYFIGLLLLANLFCFASDGAALKVLKEKADAYKKADQLDSALSVYLHGAVLAAKAEKTQDYSAFAYNVAQVYYHKGVFDSAAVWSQKTFESDKKEGDKIGMAASANLQSTVFERMNQLDKALDKLILSISLSEQLGDSLQIANGCISLGNINQKLDKHYKALEYYEKAVRIFGRLLESNPEKHDYLQGSASAYYEMGRVNKNLKEYSLAFKNLKKALSLREKLGGSGQLAIIYNELGHLSILQSNYEGALPYFGLALRHKMLIGDQQGVAVVYANFASVYLSQSRLANGSLDQEKLESAESFAERSVSLAKELDDKSLLHKNYELQYEICRLRDDFEKALQFHELYMAYHDSLFNEQRVKIIENASQKYETERKEKENLILQHQNNIQSLTIKRQKTISSFSFAFAALILLVFIVLYISYRNKQKKNRIISEQNNQLTEQNRKITDQNSQITEQKKEIEDKNKDLTDSINYAQKIQEAMMSDGQKLTELFDDAFILLQPKDIVSGDFYWLGYEGKRVIIGAIDCTGHGVPGAFMSMLGDSYLNHVVHVEKITDPAIILENLNKQIKKALNQEETNNQDGMDMSLCSVDLEKRVVEWAGAKNPLVFIKNGEIVKIKADSRPIGGHAYGEIPFTKHTVEIDSDTSFYMFSDGYQDQFGGPKNKKFMVKKMQKYFLEIHKKPMHEQKELLLAEFSKWKGDNEQIDDVLIVGFKMNHSAS